MPVMGDAGGEAVTRIVLVRHGESRATVDGIVGGHAGCKGLSEHGVRQAEALRDRLAATGEVRADVLLASVLPRAIETAEIIAPALGDPAIVQDCDLCELHPGECDGMTWDEYLRNYRPEGWSFDPDVPMAPGGESATEFRSRVTATLARLAEEHRGRTVVIACHGGIIDGSMVGLLDVPVAGSIHALFDTANTSLTEWQRREADRRDGASARWRLVRYNDAAHLATLSRVRPGDR